MMVKPTMLGRTERMSFAKIGDTLEMPNLIEVQKKSYKWFLDEGTARGAARRVPDHRLLGQPRNRIHRLYHRPDAEVPEEECKERDTNFAAPLRVTVRLTNKATGEVKESAVFMGDFPLMTDNGTFIINGAERVIVSQIVRSPGIYYETSIDKTGKVIFAATVIPLPRRVARI